MKVDEEGLEFRGFESKINLLIELLVKNDETQVLVMMTELVPEYHKVENPSDPHLNFE